MAAGRLSISRLTMRDVAILALSLFIVTCSGSSTQPQVGATQLVFKVDPTSTTAGNNIAPSVVVEAHDASGNLATDYTGTVALTFAANPGSGTLSGTASLPAVGGVATFTNLSINKSGAGYRLQAASGSLTNAQSALFNIAAGPASKLGFASVPASFSAGVPFSVTVNALDAFDNIATTFAGSVTLLLSGGPSGTTLSGITTVTVNAGVATFLNLSIDKIGNGFSFTASAGGLTVGSSTSFTVAPGAVRELIITQQPTNTVSGTPITPVTVTAHDSMGNVATGFTGSVGLAITSGTGTVGATLDGSVSVPAVAGVATFSTLKILKAGTGYTLSATSTGVTGVTGATTAPFDVTAAAAVKLAYVVAPSTSFAGSAITPAVQVAAEDQNNNVVPSFTDNIAIAIGTNPVGGTLAGTMTVAAAAGMATFADLKLDKAGPGYTLVASTPKLPNLTSGVFNILSGAGTRIVFAVQPPASVTGGAAINPPVQVAIRDTLGNTATDFNGLVTIAIGTNPVGGALTGTATVSAVAGVATFSNLIINKVGTGYTLSASTSILTPATSTAFDVVAGQASKLVFSQQPSNAVSGVGISPAIQVTAQDAGGNPVTTFAGLVAIVITPGTGTAGALLSGTNAVSAVGGVATFTGMSIDKSGTGFTLDATSGGLTGTSSSFNIAPGAATQLFFSSQPTTAASGAAIAPAVSVTALDAHGNVATGFTGNIALGITTGTGTSGATLSGTTTVAAVAGVANYANLSIDKMGPGYTLTAASNGLTSAISTAFDISVGVATKLAFTVQPSNLITGGTITPAVQVSALDAGNNVVPSFTGLITVAIGTNPGGGTLTGTLSGNAVAGVASFSTLSIDKSGVGYTLAASSGLTGATSAAFNVAAGAAKTLQFTVQPTSGPAGVAITPAVVVTALDSLSNVATGFTGNVTMAIGTNPAAGALSGTLSVAAVGGVASFSTLKIDKMGTGYTLVASGTNLTSATSTPFDILIGVATKLVITTQPVNTTAGVAITPAIVVTAQDVAGNTDPTFVGSITLAIKSGTGTSGALLRGTATVGAVAGVATFSTINIDKAGTGYVLNATSGTLIGASTSSFNITAGPAVSLLYTAQPAVSQKSGSTLTPTLKVAAVDSLGNTVTTFVSNIAIAIGNNAGTPVPGTLTGTLSVKASSGVASFSTLKIDKVGTGYTLVASSAGLLSAVSTAFNVAAGTATQLTFSTQPLSTAALTTMPPVAVTAFDAAGNVATGFTSNVTVALGTIPTVGAALHGTLVVKAAAGVATFSTLSVDSVGNGYTLTATASAVTGATSGSFDITNGSHLVFSVQPSAVSAGATITPAVQVTAKDAANATLTAFTGPVTVAILGGSGTVGAVLSGTLTVNAVAGVATFSNLAINLGGIGYKLAASSSGFSAATSNAFTVTSTVGAATKLGFIQQPTTTPAGSVIAPGVVVAVQDASGNTVKGLTGTITVAIGTNPASGTLAGTTTVNINAGLGNFSNLSINNVGAGYTLAATTSLVGLTGATSTPFDVTAAATVHLVFTVQPVATTAGQNITPAVQVSAENASNVVVTSFTGPILVTITPGTCANGATLGGTTTVSAVNGVAAFSNLAITKVGKACKLTASSAGTAAATSTSFLINPDVATHLVFSVEPTTGTHGTVITPAVVVEARDQFSNLVPSFVGNVAVAILSGTGTAGAVLSGTTPVTAVAGAATFSNLSINLAGTAYRLTATTATLAAATTIAFSEN